MDSPFSWTKQVASDFGGARNGMVIHWPNGIKAKGEVRSQFGHVIDIAPTVFEAVKIPAPRRWSMAFSRIRSKERASFTHLTMPMLKKRTPFNTSRCSVTGRSTATVGMHEPFTDRHGSEKPSGHSQKIRGSFTTQMKISAWRTTLLRSNAAKLKELQALFMTEAEKYHVLPIDDRLLERTNAELVGRPTVMEGRNSMTLGPGHERHGRRYFHRHPGKSYTMTADVEDGARRRDCLPGWQIRRLLILRKRGKPTFTYNYLGLEKFVVASSQALKPGKHTIVYDFKSDGGLGKGGMGTITIDGTRSAKAGLKKRSREYSLWMILLTWDRRRNTSNGLWRFAKIQGTLNKVTIQVRK